LSFSKFFNFISSAQILHPSIMSSSGPRRSSARTRKPTVRYTQLGRSTEKHARGFNTTNSEAGAEEQPRAAEPPHSDDEEATAQELAPEDVAAPTVLADSLIGPTAADRLAIAEQHVKTMAEKSKSVHWSAENVSGSLRRFAVAFDAWSRKVLQETIIPLDPCWQGSMNSSGVDCLPLCLHRS
jgi:hypothetical protein